MGGSAGQRGFTLLEVLVASVILFAAVAVAGQLWRNALDGFSRAGDVALLSGMAPYARDAIWPALERGDRAGDGRLGSVVFEWRAESAPAQRMANAPDLDSPDAVPGGFMLQSHTVRLEMRVPGGGRRAYSYRALTWEPV